MTGLNKTAATARSGSADGADTRRWWIAVASADHAARGRAGGYMQVCHGKVAPLRRLKQGDMVIYYAPAMQMGSKTLCQVFVSIGEVINLQPYACDMGEGFVPYRRDVAYWPAQQAAIRPLLDALAFTRGRRNWGYAFRFGLLEISADDGAIIARAMQAEQPSVHQPADQAAQ
ncbi:hypothetical protein IGB42_02356 [Andreprevotia sp. IGB-42]|uniref:EVE domain-containing protein n=1 Tax=Andreprevotia sp. IGB-42 TaxID=2497473 RepID=UPI00135835FD|nr:EVE domain-containing protein [Andreprevotia sp. IGB-42]KAF0812961.1 hypothetical protein IGB42_02356 [Andreprevotia sp. IGB-42]